MLKKALSKEKFSNRTKRSKITALIAKKKSRQEFIPALGAIIDRTYIQPLHLKNKACLLAHRYLLHEVIAISCLPKSIKIFSEIPSSSPFSRYVSRMKTKCCLPRLSKKIIKWFDETQAEGKNLDYRFTGKESRLFLHNFMYLIDVVEPAAHQGTKRHFTVHVLAYFCLTVQDCVFLFSQIEIPDEELIELEHY